MILSSTFCISDIKTFDDTYMTIYDLYIKYVSQSQD